MEELTFTCETITPMFCYGADGETPEIRAQSIKGLLRFWWRSIQTFEDENKLYKEESSHFGGGGDDAQISNVRIRVRFDRSITSTKRIRGKRHEPQRINRDVSFDLLQYLAFGVQGGGVYKEYFQPNSEFTLTISGRESAVQELKMAFVLLEAFGGMGAKSRNGFGCFQSNFEDGMKLDLGEIQKANIKKYTAFSSQSVIWLAGMHNTWQDALCELSKIYYTGRELLNDELHRPYLRQYIGHPVKWDSHNTSGKLPQELQRHSKPYFLHVRKNDGQFQGQVLFLPSIFSSDSKLENREHLQEKYEEACSKLNNTFDKNMSKLEYEEWKNFYSFLQ